MSPSSEHSATCSPPPPPPHFNPPAGFPADSPSETISPPGGASIVSPTKFFPLDVAPFRPSSPSIHRISTESVPTPKSEASSVSSNQSAHSGGGDHLVEMRERLRSESLTSSTPPGRSRASSQATHEGSRLSVTSSNASSETVIDDTAEEQDYERSGPMRRLTSGVLAGLEEAPDLPIDHAWDSVVRHFLFSSQRLFTCNLTISIVASGELNSPACSARPWIGKIPYGPCLAVCHSFLLSRCHPNHLFKPKTKISQSRIS